MYIHIGISPVNISLYGSSKGFKKPTTPVGSSRERAIDVEATDLKDDDDLPVIGIHGHTYNIMTLKLLHVLHLSSEDFNKPIVGSSQERAIDIEDTELKPPPTKQHKGNLYIHIIHIIMCSSTTCIHSVSKPDSDDATVLALNSVYLSHRSIKRVLNTEELDDTVG